MGRDKAQLLLDGDTLLERAIEAATSAADTVAVVGRAAPDRPIEADVTWLPDDEPGLGPIGGLKTALTHLNAPVALLACDMPLVDGEALDWLLETSNATTAPHGMATVRDERAEPLFSVYRPQVSTLVDKLIAQKRRSLTGLIARGDFAHIEAPPRIADKLINVNTPEDFEALRG